MRHALMAVLALLVSACAQQPQQPPQQTSTDEELVQELASEMMMDLLNRNGPRILCTQPAYNECYSQTETQCLSDLQNFHAGCMQYAVGKAGELKLNNNEELFGKVYAGCMAMRHITLYPEQLKPISSCIKNMKADHEKASRALLDSSGT